MKPTCAQFTHFCGHKKCFYNILIGHTKSSKAVDAHALIKKNFGNKTPIKKKEYFLTFGCHQTRSDVLQSQFFIVVYKMTVLRVKIYIKQGYEDIGCQHSLGIHFSSII